MMVAVLLLILAAGIAEGAEGSVFEDTARLSAVIACVVGAVLVYLFDEWLDRR